MQQIKLFIEKGKAESFVPSCASQSIKNQLAMSSRGSGVLVQFVYILKCMFLKIDTNRYNNVSILSKVCVKDTRTQKLIHQYANMSSTQLIDMRKGHGHDEVITWCDDAFAWYSFILMASSWYVIMTSSHDVITMVTQLSYWGLYSQLSIGGI